MRISDWSSDVCSSDLPSTSSQRELPSGWVQRMCTSAPGSTNGKYDGRNSASMSRSKKRDKKICRSYLRSASETFTATYRPSIWWNIGLCVRSERSEEHTSELQ